MRHGLTMLLGIWLAACGGQARSPMGQPEPNLDDAGAGADADADAGSSPITARLQPWQLTSPGMPPLVLGIYDREQKLHCEFMADAAGDLRCLPLVPDGLSGHDEFADPSCQMPVFDDAFSRYASASKLVSIPLPASTACGTTRHSVGRLTSLQAGSPRYVRDLGGSCVDSSYELSAPMVVLTDITPPDTWQAGSETAGALLTPRLRVNEVQTADGARFPSTLFDERWAQPCRLISSDPDRVACLPSGALHAGLLYDDARCQSQLWSSDGCVNPTFGVDDGSSYFSLIPYTGPVFRGGGLGCFAQGSQTDTGTVYFSSGNQLVGDVLATPRWNIQGNGRFRHRVIEDDQGRPVALGENLWPSGDASFRLEDRDRSARCQIFWTESSVRCLPETVYVNTISTQFEFADAECTEPAYLCPMTNCDGITFMPGFHPEHGHLRADPLRRAKEIGNRYWARIEGVCAPGTLPELTFFRADGEVSWDEYPALTEVNGSP